MKERFFMGIDPGRHGAVCVVDSEGKIADLYPMPATLDGLQEILDSWRPNTTWHAYEVMCVIEKVGAFKGNAPQAMFNFGRNYGNLEAAVYCTGIPMDEVTPQKWQQHFQLGKSADHATKKAWKDHLWIKAKKFYPGVDIKKYAADAVLLARYCWERYK